MKVLQTMLFLDYYSPKPFCAFVPAYRGERKKGEIRNRRGSNKSNNFKYAHIKVQI